MINRYAKISFAKWPYPYTKYLKTPYTCHIGRYGRMYDKYYKNITLSSVRRLTDIMGLMTLTNKPHKNLSVWECERKQ